MPEEDSCPSTYSPGRSVVMTTPFETALLALQHHVGSLTPEPSSRTLEALLVQLEQIIERARASGAVDDWEDAAESARHALSSGDTVLAADILRDATIPG